MVPPRILLIDKPSGLSSAQTVGRLKRTFHLKRKDRIGHAGTLDPAATGLLICLLGRATKLASYIGGGLKEYKGIIKLGVTTSTDDLEGETLSQFDGTLPPLKTVQGAVEQFVGNIHQVPPAVSAVKVDGKRAYALVREGKEVKLAAKTVHVELFEVGPTDHEGEFSYRVVCGSGTYIRALARDLGEVLGVGGAIATLRRTASFPFLVSEATPLEEVTDTNLLHWERAFSHLKVLSLSLSSCRAIFQGNMRKALPELELALRKSETHESESLYLFGNELSGDIYGMVRYQEGEFSVAFLDIDRFDQGSLQKKVTLTTSESISELGGI